MSYTVEDIELIEVVKIAKSARVPEQQKDSINAGAGILWILGMTAVSYGILMTINYALSHIA